jgi:hypothetical protein
MKIFFIKVFILLIWLIVGIGIIVFSPLPANSYDLAIIDKHRNLANTKSPKIVLAGGSNLAFGIDSAAIQDRLHIPVVNTAVHAGFGLGRILDDISRFLHKGDVLLIIPEYGHFTSGWNGESVAYELILDIRQYQLLWSSYHGLPSGFSQYFSTKYAIFKQTVRQSIKQINTQNENPLVYSRNGFNEYGDYIKHLGMGNQPFDSYGNGGIINRTYLKNYFRLVDDFSKRGITVILSYPSLEEQSFRNSAALIQELDMLFRAKENLLVISKPEFYCYPAEYFFDTAYHLNREGRAVRTAQLIQDLQACGLFATDDVAPDTDTFIPQSVSTRYLYSSGRN